MNGNSTEAHIKQKSFSHPVLITYEFHNKNMKPQENWNWAPDSSCP